MYLRLHVPHWNRPDARAVGVLVAGAFAAIVVLVFGAEMGWGNVEGPGGRWPSEEKGDVEMNSRRLGARRSGSIGTSGGTVGRS